MHSPSQVISHVAPLIRDLALILGVAGIVTLIFQKLRQPVVLGYIVAGMLVGKSISPLPLVADIPSIQTWAQLGVIFLMFSLGLEFSFRKLARVGLSAVLTTAFEVSVMLALGFTAAKLLGWSTRTSVFVGAMVSISSTTIIVRALDEMNLKTRRFAEMIFGILIVEDLIAVLILVALSTLSAGTGGQGGGISGLMLLAAAGKLILVVAAWFVTGYFIVPRFVRYVGRVGTNEMLTLVSLALCLGLVLFSAYFDYSVALGGFIMGSILAESSESFRIEERIEPLRDLFAAIFFVSVGMMIDPATVWAYKGTILALAALTICGKVIGTTAGALLTGQTLRTSVQVGFGIAQIGEFSFIIAGMALSLHAAGDFIYPVAVAISVITTFTTPYMIRVSHKFAVALEAKIPLRLRNAMVQYVTWARERTADTAARKAFYQLLFKWLLNGLIVTTIFMILGTAALPWAREQAAGTGPTNLWGLIGLVGWLVAVAIASPFLWAMFNAFRGFQLHFQQSQGGTLFAFRLLTLVWVGFLSPPFLPLRAVFFLMAGLIAGLVIFFRTQLERSYHWFEGRFVATFQNAEKTPSHRDMLRHLAPWDVHLVRMKVHPNSTLVLKSIAQSHLRSRAGINVVVIQRGLKSIIAPRPDELILPKDELLVLATDEQIESVRGVIEKPPGLAERFAPTQQYEQESVRVTQDSPIVGKTVRESGISENFGAMLVGVERANHRHINPKSDLKIQTDDILWLVGEKESLARLTALISGTL